MSINSPEEVPAVLEQLKSVREQIDSTKNILSELNAKHEEISNILLEYIEKTKQNGIKVSGLLHVYKVEHYDFRQPDGVENEQAFNNWLKEEELDHLRKVNYQTLNSELNRRREKAIEEGQLFQPPPGIELPNLRIKLNVRKA